MEFVVAKGFNGHAWIILDPASDEIPLFDGVYRVMIPQDGVLRVRSFRPFEEWHESRSRYDDGTHLQIMHGYPDDSDAFGLWFGSRGSTSGGAEKIELYVGTARQFKEKRARPPESRP